MAARVPEMPSSLSLTLAAVAGLAFIFAHAGHAIAGAKAARGAAEEVRRKAERLGTELGAIAAVGDQGKALASARGSHTSAAEHAANAERMTDLLRNLREAFRRSEQAAAMLEAAVGKAKPFGPTLERLLPGWNDRTSALTPLLEQLRRDLERSRRESEEGHLEQDAHTLLSRALAEQGLQEWAASLPVEDQELVNEDDVEPVRWDPEQGWQPGHA
jgi:hypothetical protein